MKPSKIKLKREQILSALELGGLLVAKNFQASTMGSTLEVTTDFAAASDLSAFIAISGTRFDAHTNLHNRTTWPCAVAIIEDDAGFSEDTLESNAWIRVTSTRAAWACLCAEYHEHPERKLSIVGVTGTNGKTSTVWFVRQLLAAAGVKSLSIGTLGAWVGDDFFELNHTTPDPPLLFHLMAMAVKQGIRFAEMEVSSHALVQNRIFGLKFAGIGFTSFSRDHMDFHSSEDDYFNAKMLVFFRHAVQQTVAVCHLSLMERIRSTLGRSAADLRWRSYAFETDSNSNKKTKEQEELLDVRALEASVKGTKLQMNSATIRHEGVAPVTGSYSCENFSAACLLVQFAFGISPEPGLWERVEPVPGRMEPVFARRQVKGPAVVVDYAHTPDALEKVLKNCRNLVGGKGRVIVVFGCGGDRDRGKRPLMGALAEKLTDFVVVTSDNPRTEDPDAIVGEIRSGFSEGQKNLRVETDRKLAIHFAIKSAKPEDIVVIAGKGHESYQEVAGIKYPFDDRTIARNVLESL